MTSKVFALLSFLASASFSVSADIERHSKSLSFSAEDDIVILCTPYPFCKDDPSAQTVVDHG